MAGHPDTTHCGDYAHPRLHALVQRATQRATALAQEQGLPVVALVCPSDALSLHSALDMHHAGLARPLLIGPREAILRSAEQAGLPAIAAGLFDIVDVPGTAGDAARQACHLVRSGAASVLMKGSLHSDELMSAVVHKSQGLHGQTRFSHAFVFDLPRYHKLLALADCVVNIAPHLRTKTDIVGNAVAMLQRLGVAHPKVAVVAAVETVKAKIPATEDAQALVEMAAAGRWPNASVEGPFGFDNAFSAQAARIKGLHSKVAGDADLLIMPELNAGNMLYKSFVYVGGGDCAGLVLGGRAPVVLTSRADSALSRLASVALAVLTAN